MGARRDMNDSVDGQDDTHATATPRVSSSTTPDAGNTPNSVRVARKLRRRRILRGTANTIGELLLLAALVLALYIVWQLWWTGVESSKTQSEVTADSAWSAPASSGAGDGTYAVAPDQSADTAPSSTRVPATGALVATIYIPRFGSTWERTVVQGTDLAQLNTGGLGHYVTSSMPGALGNFVIAGHRGGYGDPLADVDKLQTGDAIIIRTEDYWYVYHYTSYEIVTPDTIEVTWPVPYEQDATPTKRLITMTTCHPRLQRSTHRWIAYGELAHWNRVAEGLPSELVPAAEASQGTLFTRTTTTTSTTTTITRRGLSDVLPEPSVACRALLLAYAVVWLSAVIAWRWPGTRRARLKALKAVGGVEDPGRVPDGPVGLLTRIQPGVYPVRVVEVLILFGAGAAALFAWVFPWAASTIPWFQVASSYVVVT